MPCSLQELYPPPCAPPPDARALSGIEALLGQAFPVVLVARLVGLQVLQAAERRSIGTEGAADRDAWRRSLLECRMGKY